MVIAIQHPDKIILALLFFITFTYLQSQFLVKLLVQSLHSSLVERIDYFLKTSNLKSNRSWEKWEEEFDFLHVFAELKEVTYFPTRVIGYGEAIVFSALTIFVSKSQNHLDVSILTFFLGIIFGWTALKIVGNFRTWEGKFTGRYFFYTFLIGTIVNVSLSIFSGLIISYFILK